MADYSYDRTADTGPASRLKNVAPHVRTAERELERAQSILHGLVREMEMVAKHTHDRTIRHNFEVIAGLSSRLDEIDKGMDKFVDDLEHFLRSYR